MLCSCCCPKAPIGLREPLCEEMGTLELRNNMKDMKQQIESIQTQTEQTSLAICSLREMLDVFSNLFISAVDTEIDRKIEQRLGGRASPMSTDSSRSE
jgi:hypothetical protein